MTLSSIPAIKRILIPALIFILHFTVIQAKDYMVRGSVTDQEGTFIPNARVSFLSGTREYVAMTRTDGTYSVRISGIYDDISGLIETGVPYPNPFSRSVNIPFIINTTGDIRFTVYNFSGIKITEFLFNSVEAGSYQIVWDGCNQSGASQSDGLYFYSVNFKGITKSGKLIKAAGFSYYSAGTALEPVMMPPVTLPSSGHLRLQVVSSVTCENYYPLRLTDITIAQDTVINFELALKQGIPFKTIGDNIAMYSGTSYRPLVLKGINLGSSPPGYFPGEIAYAISSQIYEEWINQMADAGFNCIRVYTLHPPVFYEKLANYNERHPDNPLLLFQGIWLDEVEDPHDPAAYDLINRITAFRGEIHEVVDCINGKGDVAFRYGKSYGRYLTDMSRWTAGYILGREISPQEVDSTNSDHLSVNSYSGNYFDISGASASEVFVTEMMDEAVKYEAGKYTVKRPMSISSWPTLDPLVHPTEIYTDEDKASYDITKISLKQDQAGIFASYHAYPYYPNFISEEPGYMAYSDEEGPDSYLGYLNALKAHYSGMPLVIAEFGVPSSWGSAHQSFSNMHHGGYSEQQQGEKDLRLLHNIINSGCAGGFMFAWMDEWFKPTWIVSYLEAYGIYSNGTTIPTRQLWHNLTSPEQNFGLITYEQKSTLPFISYLTDKPDGPTRKISATNDNSYFLIEIEAERTLSPGDTVMIAFDTYLRSLGESLLPNGKKLTNRSEFLLNIKLGEDTALYDVTEAYDMNGLTVRFDLADHAVQKFHSTITDGAPWKLMKWINDGFTFKKQDIGKLPVEHSSDFSYGERSAVAWSGNTIRVRIPWTMLYFYDPTQMEVIDGAVSYDGGYNYEISTAKSDGIAVSVYFGGTVISTESRYTWPQWLIVPATVPKEKRSLQVIKSGLSSIPGFTDQ